MHQKYKKGGQLQILQLKAPPAVAWHIARNVAGVESRTNLRLYASQCSGQQQDQHSRKMIHDIGQEENSACRQTR